VQARMFNSGIFASGNTWIYFTRNMTVYQSITFNP